MWNSREYVCVWLVDEAGTPPLRIIYGVHICGSFGTDWNSPSWKPHNGHCDEGK